MKITNTLSGVKELFSPHKAPDVTMYVCGITPYDYAHLGHGRSAVAFDLLYRVLTFLDFKVTYCRNFTDIDDKIIARAVKELGSADRYHEIAQKYITAYQQDMVNLHCVTPVHQPLVTQTITEIIEFVQGLIDAGMAYEVDGDVYFRVNKFPAYGELSKQKISELRSGARVDVNEKKEDPLDFALWKKDEDGKFWKSPWGYGRPGWHIECSVMAAKYLGDQIDVHGGGMDLMFPHHENEIAQSEGLSGKQFVRYWVHNAFVRINQEKMSKSLGNFFTLREVFEKYPSVLIRYYFLNHHHRSPLDFSFDDLDALHKSYQRLCRVFASADCGTMNHEEIKKSAIVQKMIHFLSDDLNAAGMWGVVFENLDTLQANQQELCAVKGFIQQVLGLPLELLPEKKVELTPEIEQLLKDREAARAAKDWKKSDAIRDQLTALGYQVQDKKM